MHAVRAGFECHVYRAYFVIHSYVQLCEHVAVVALHDVTRGELARAYSCEVHGVLSGYQFFERHNLRLVLEIRLVLKKKVNTI